MINKIITVICALMVSVSVQAERLITIGPGVTDIVYALGQGKDIVAVDDASKAVVSKKNAGTEVKTVGYQRKLSSEGLLSLKLDRLIGTEDMGPPMVLEHLRKAGVAVTLVPSGYQLDDLERRIDAVAKVFAREQQGKALWQGVRKQLQAASERAKTAIAKDGKPRKVIYLMAHGGTPLVAGANTTADTLIRLAGAENPARSAFSGYRPVSAEALLSMAPYAVIVGDDALVQQGSADHILKLLPGIQATPAGRAERVVTVDDTTLMGGLGLRIGEVALKLAQDINSG